jgi:hypothetical protein
LRIFSKKNEEMLGSIVGQIGQIKEKNGDLKERINTFQENSGSRPPLPEVGPTISVGGDEEYTTIYFPNESTWNINCHKRRH